MAIFSIPGVKITGIAASVPKQEFSNYDLDLISEKDRELLIKTTGIEKRRIATPGTCTSDLCHAASDKLLNELKWERSEVSLLVFVTQTPDYITPATAIVLQERLGLSKNCLAFDINLGCSGYVYGLSVIASLLSRMPSGKGLLLVGDVSSACISHIDKSVAPIFSDAGSATALEADSVAPAMVFNLENDGKGYEAIMIPEGGYRKPVTEESLKYIQIEPGISRNKTHLVLNGIDVFNFSIREVPRNVTELLNSLDLGADKVDYFVFHQANKLINDSIRKKLKLDESQTPSSLKNFGNTSSATIPVTMVTELQSKLQAQPLNLVLCGFGVGLSWGSVYLQTSSLKCLPLVEI
jgi:3-oxoacyl-[acyl-carrier-protein] synthase-3